jgi:hypothetical protein
MILGDSTFASCRVRCPKRPSRHILEGETSLSSSKRNDLVGGKAEVTAEMWLTIADSVKP